MPAISKPMLGRGASAQELRSDLGAYVRELRENKRLTQAELAREVGMEYYTGISAIEVGRNVIPPERLVAFADALGVQPKVFAKRVLQYTNPWVYAALYAEDPRAAVEELNKKVTPRHRADR